MCERICKICGGDDEVAKIGERMGFRPDVAFARIRKLEAAIACFCREELGNMCFENDKEAVDHILSYLDA